MRKNGLKDIREADSKTKNGGLPKVIAAVSVFRKKIIFLLKKLGVTKIMSIFALGRVGKVERNDEE
jgi:hypothetical protein